MRRSARASAALLLAALAACTRQRATPDLTLTAAPRATLDVEADAARAVVAAFVAAEAEADPGADTLLASDATFVAGGISVTVRPRLAALNGPGTALLEAVSTHVAGPVTWVVAVYRFEARTPALSDRGRLTVVLEKQRAGWRIRHVHSSSVERW